MLIPKKKAIENLREEMYIPVGIFHMNVDHFWKKKQYNKPIILQKLKEKNAESSVMISF